MATNKETTMLDYQKNYSVYDGLGDSIAQGVQGLDRAKEIARIHKAAYQAAGRTDCTEMYVYDAGATYDHERGEEAPVVWSTEED